MFGDLEMGAAERFDEVHSPAPDQIVGHLVDHQGDAILLRGQIVLLDAFGEAEAIAEAGAAAALDAQPQDRRLALALGDRGDTGRRCWSQCDFGGESHILQIRRAGSTGKLTAAIAADDPEQASGRDALLAKKRSTLAPVRGRFHMRSVPGSERKNEMKTRVYVTLKNGVLDPQGKAIHHALEGLGFTGVNNVRAGKLIELDLADDVTDEAIESMCRKLLANTVIENFRIEREDREAAE